MRHEPLVRGYDVTHPPGEVRLPTRPGWQLVLHTDAGVLTARDAHSGWTVPPDRALCIGDSRNVRVATRHRTNVRCLYLDESLDAVPAGVRVLDTTPLERELLRHAVRSAPLDLDDAASRAVVTLLADRIAVLPTVPLRLPRPSDDRARALAELILARPERPLGDVVGDVAASRRTLERAFRAETSLTLGRWHRRARALAAIELIAEGHSVTRTATAVGYSTASSFVAAFKAELGMAPGTLMGRRRA